MIPKEIGMRKNLLPALALIVAFGLLNLRAADPPAPRTEAEKKALEKIRQLGGLAIEVAQNDKRLEVSYLQTDGKFSDDYLTPLKDLKGVVHLNLRNQPVTDAQLAHIKGLTDLTHLHLEKTKITDKGLEQLKGLTNLEYLNVYGTEVTDAGLAQLEGLKKLKNVYVWQTKITDAGAAKLKQAIPGVDVNRGIEEKPKDEPKDKKKEEPKDKDKKKVEAKDKDKKKDK
jgi:hypothetical protein